MHRTIQHATIALILGGAGLFAAEPLADPAGCKDLKLFSKAGGCAITECSAKRSDSAQFQMDAARQQEISGPTASVRYSCGPTATLDTVVKDLLPSFKKAGYTVIYQDNEDTSRIITGHRGGDWLDMDASLADSGAVSYTLTSVDAVAIKTLSGEVCSDAGLLTLPKGCTLTECSAKRNDTVEIRSGAEAQVTVAGSVRSTTISCEVGAGKVRLFDVAQLAVKAAGFEILYSSQERPEEWWITARSGKRWVEFATVQDAGTASCQLTDVQAETATAANHP